MSATATTPIFSEVGPVARRLGVSVSTVHLWVREGRVAPLRTAGGVMLFTEEQVTALQRQREERLAARAAGQTPQAA